MSELNSNTRERILAAATMAAQTRGYGGLSFRDLAKEVGIKAASIYHYFPSKADLGAAVARRYWEDSAATLESLSAESSDPILALRRYSETFRKALENDNRMCLCSYMAAEYDELPEAVAMLGDLAQPLARLIEAPIGLDAVPAAYERLIAGGSAALKTIIRP